MQIPDNYTLRDLIEDMSNGKNTVPKEKFIKFISNLEKAGKLHTEEIKKEPVEHWNRDYLESVKEKIKDHRDKAVRGKVAGSKDALLHFFDVATYLNNKEDE